MEPVVREWLLWVIDGAARQPRPFSAPGNTRARDEVRELTTGYDL